MKAPTNIFEDMQRLHPAISEGSKSEVKDEENKSEPKKIPKKRKQKASTNDGEPHKKRVQNKK